MVDAEMPDTEPASTSFTGADLDRRRLDEAARRAGAHPRFDAALEMFCAGVVDSFEGDRLSNRLMGQAGRFAMLAFTIALHAEHQAGRDTDGVTVTRLAALLGKRKLASPGRTHALVGVLRAAGAIEPAGPSPDNRERPLRPTALMLAQAARWVERSLAPAALVTPLPAPAADLVRRPGFVERYFAHMVAPYAREGFILYDGFPEIERMMKRQGGYVLMLEMLRTAQRSAAGTLSANVPSGPVAARLKISRAQVRSILRMAETRGWLALRARGSRVIELDPAFAARLRHWVATELAWGGDLARRAAADPLGSA